jgi:hypothetical protein
MKTRIWKLFLVMLAAQLSLLDVKAGKISGKVFNQQSMILPFASILVKGTTLGTTANNQGEYFLNLPAGTYHIICQHVGFTKSEKEITVSDEPLVLNFVLTEQELSLTEIVVKSGSEDPAYAIIRQAIKKRTFYKSQVASFQCGVYIKGQIKLRDYPNKLFGQKIDFEDGDTSKQKMIFLSETIARYTFQQPDKEKIEVFSTRVSGQSNGLGFSSPQFISFYENNVQLSGALNPRGFISPIADGALNFYKYKYQGAYFEDGRQVNRIQVIPKRNYEPLFSGFIEIMENDWRIHSINLKLLKTSQMELLDTLQIEQLYVPVKEDIWMVNSQTIYPSIKIFGFNAHGYFTTLYSDYTIGEAYAKSFFGRTLIKFDTASNKRNRGYWDSTRPIPLQEDELADYHKKDSLEERRKDPHYLDSLDSRQNKFSAMGLLMTGQTFNKRKAKSSFSYDPLLKAISFNTVEGWALQFAGTYRKELKGRKQIRITPVVRYGTSNGHLNAFGIGEYRFGKTYFNSITFSGGKRIFQFNNANPIPQIINTYTTLLKGYNYMKIYEAWFANLQYAKGIGEGLTVRFNLNFQDRRPLNNTDTNTVWGNQEKKSNFTPNFPVEIATENISHHQALVAGFSISYRPGSKYIELPDRKINIGSKYPLFSLSYYKGIDHLFGSDVDFDKWRFSIQDECNLKLAGELRYKVLVGGFLNNKKVELPDYQHFNGNRVSYASEYLNSFQLAPYYQKSNTDKFFSIIHVEHQFNGLLTNKIPVIKKLNLRLIGGANAFFVSRDRNYYEFFVGVNNIFKVLRLDYVWAFNDNKPYTTGMKWGLRIFTDLFQDY